MRNLRKGTNIFPTRRLDPGPGRAGSTSRPPGMPTGSMSMARPEPRKVHHPPYTSPGNAPPQEMERAREMIDAPPADATETRINVVVEPTEPDILALRAAPDGSALGPAQPGNPASSRRASIPPGTYSTPRGVFPAGGLRLRGRRPERRVIFSRPRAGRPGQGARRSHVCLPGPGRRQSGRRGGRDRARPLEVICYRILIRRRIPAFPGRIQSRGILSMSALHVLAGDFSAVFICLFADRPRSATPHSAGRESPPN